MLELYCKLASTVLGGVRSLDLSTLPLLQQDEWRSPERLAAALPYCASLRSLDLGRCQLTDAAMATLASALDADALPSLRSLSLRGNRFGGEGMSSIGEALARGAAPQLEKVCLMHTLEFGSRILKSEPQVRGLVRGYCSAHEPPPTLCPCARTA